MLDHLLEKRFDGPECHRDLDFNRALDYIHILNALLPDFS